MLKEAITKILEAGFLPSNKEQGYVLRKLLRRLWALGSDWTNEHYLQEVERQERLRAKYERLKVKHSDQPPEWWFDTHGIDLNDM